MQIDCNKALKEVSEIELMARSFTFYTSVAVISSSKIEGEQMELDSYVKHKVQDIEYLPELVEKDLYLAYLFAKDNRLSKNNFLIGSETMEVGCTVVDFDIAKTVIEQQLKGTE